MAPDRWRKIEELYHSALANGVDVLEGTDPEIRHEVESLLAQESMGKLLDRPAADILRSESDSFQNSAHLPVGLSPGTRLGPYVIEDKIGEGGMGQVFRATDTRLHRIVAIKTSISALDSRLQREARAASALNHPNICTIHDIGEYGDRTYIVMEYLEGKSLKDVIGTGAISEALVVKTATEIADALDAAHAAGIVHRDIKPANILLTNCGYTKVLDFGIAKGISSISESETSLTDSGLILGTLPYMSPEQALGKQLDSRTDLFSFGVMLFEMATGRHPFKGETGAASMGNLLHTEPPDPLSLNSALAPGWRVILTKCLQKDRDLRYQKAGEIREDLGRLGSLSAPFPALVPTFKQDQRSRASGLILASAGLAGLAVAAWVYFPRASPRLTEKGTLVLASFQNSTGDPIFDDTLRRGLSTQLWQSPAISLLPDSRIDNTLKQMGQPPGAPLTPELAKEVCERTGSAGVLEGSIATMGTQYVIGLRARDCHSGKLLDEEQTQAARKEDILKALNMVARQFRTRIGESLATIRQYDVPLEEATTTSLEALKAYTTADRINKTQSGAALAIPHYKRAIELDPNFAMAHAQLGLAYYNVSEIALAKESATKGFALRQRASEPERFFIEFLYARNVTGNLEKAWEAVQAWAQSYPRDATAHGLCAGISAIGTGRFEEALEHARMATGLDPNNTYGELNSAWANFELDRVKDAEETVRGISAKGVTKDLYALRYLLAYRRGDATAMQRILSESQGNSAVEDEVAHTAALVAASQGRLRQAAELSRRAVDLAKLGSKAERASLYAAGAATSHAVLGDWAGAERWATEALQLSTGRDAGYAAAFALEFARRSPRARQIADDLAKRFPEDTSVQTNYLPTLRGLFAKGDPAKAVKSLQAALSNERGVPAVSFNGYYGGMYPAFIRGGAYLAQKRGAQAATEFQKILDHRGLVAGDPIGVLARLQLARALVLSGEQAKAKTAYDTFLQLWKDADSDLLPLRRARAEVAAFSK